MEKISSIVPSSKRVVSTDLQGSSVAVRPGAPSFGQKVGTSTMGAPQKMSTAEKAVLEHKRLLDKRAQDQAKSVEEIAGRFFLQQMKTAQLALPEVEIPYESEAEMVDTEIGEVMAPDLGYVPPGTFISRDV